jgi:GNAT superfamily N-acetyltransferase
LSSIDYKIHTLSDRESAEKILRTLPEWFGIESALLDYCNATKTLPTYFAVRTDGSKIGFICLKFHNEFTAEIHVMGILREFHGKGIGKALVNHVSELLRQRSYEFLIAKTLGPSHPDINYDYTRRFYLSSGFCPLAEFDSIWTDILV